MGVEALGDLVVNVGVDATGLADGFQEAASQVKKGAADLGTELDGLSSGLGNLGETAKNTWGNLGGGKISLDELADSLRTTGREMISAGETLSAALTLPLAGLATAAVAAGADIQNAFAEIERQAGGTAQELAGMQQTFLTVFAALPTSAHDAAEAIGEISDRLGLSGPALTAMTTQMLNLAHITGENVKPLIEDTTRAFGQWDIATEDQSRKLDILFTAVQTTGGSVTKMAQQLTTFGPALREMGFGFDQSVALLAKFEQSGVNTSAALTGLRQALLRLGKAGVEDPVQGIQTVIQMIKDAGSAGEANAIGLKVFGRGATDLVDAIRRGKLDIKDFATELANSTQTINGVAESTRTIGDKFTILKNQIEEALQPLGGSLITILQNLFGAMQPVIALVGSMAQGFADLDRPTQNTILALAGTAAALGPVLVAIGLMSNGLATLMPLISTSAGAVGIGGAGLTGGLLALAAAAAAVNVTFTEWISSKIATFLAVNVSDSAMMATKDLEAMAKTINNQLTNGLQAATTSSTAFQTAWKNSVAAAKSGVDAYGLSTDKTKQSTDQVRAALDKLIDGSQKTAQAMKAIPFKDLIDVDTQARLQAYTAEHGKLYNAIVAEIEQIDKDHASIGDLTGALTDQQAVTESTQQALEDLTSKTMDLVDAQDTLTPAIQDTIDLVTEMAEPVNTLGDAMETLGVKSVTDAREAMDQADSAMATLTQQFQAGIVTLGEYNQGLATLAQNELDLALAQGADAQTVATLRANLEAAKALAEGSTLDVGKAKTVWGDLGKQLNSVFSGLSRSIASVIVDGGKWSDVLKTLEKDLLRVFIDVGLKVVTRFIVEGLAKLMGKLGFGGLSDLLDSIAGKIGGVFKSGGSAVGGAAGDAAGGSGGIGGAIAGAVSSSLTGIVSAVSGVVSAISGVIGNFQMAHMNTALGRIEESTRRMDIATEQQGDSVLATLHLIRNYTLDVKQPIFDLKSLTYEIEWRISDMHGFIKNLLEQIRDNVILLRNDVLAGAVLMAQTVIGVASMSNPALAAPGVAGSSSAAYNNIIVQDPDIVSLANQIVALLRRNGLKL